MLKLGLPPLAPTNDFRETSGTGKLEEMLLDKHHNPVPAMGTDFTTGAGGFTSGGDFESLDLVLASARINDLPEGVYCVTVAATVLNTKLLHWKIGGALVSADTDDPIIPVSLDSDSSPLGSKPFYFKISSPNSAIAFKPNSGVNAITVFVRRLK
jgi:hypothetical protein